MKYVFSVVAGLILGIGLTVGGCGKKAEVVNSQITDAVTQVAVDAGVVLESGVTDAVPAVLEQGKLETKPEPVALPEKK